MCGINTSTNAIVPISSKDANSPRSLSAVACIGMSAINAPTVVMLPTNSGLLISFNVCLTDDSCVRCAMRWSG